MLPEVELFVYPECAFCGCCGYCAYSIILGISLFREWSSCDEAGCLRRDVLRTNEKPSRRI